VTTTEFQLRDLIRDVIGKSALADPDDLAAAVLAEIPEELTREALAQALRPIVRQVAAHHRLHTRIVSEQTLEQLTPPSAGSAKVRAIRDWWKRALLDSYHVSDGAIRYKLLRDCTADDLAFAIEERRAMARRNDAKADQLEIVQRLVLEHGVNQVGQLPEATLAATLRPV
jgi:hypothetical protein